MKRVGILCLALFFSALAISEEKWDFSESVSRSCESVGASALDIRLCINAEYEKTDKELNRVYKQLIESLVNPSDLIRA